MFSKGMIYIAAPYWSDDEDIRADRQQKAIEYSVRLTQAGILNYSPLLYSEKFKGENIPESYWITHCLKMLKACDSVVVLCLPGWEDSKGVERECLEAKKLKLGIKYVEAG